MLNRVQKFPNNEAGKPRTDNRLEETRMRDSRTYSREAYTQPYMACVALPRDVCNKVRMKRVSPCYVPEMGLPNASCALPDVVVGGVERPQGGGGVDHPTKVQQKRAQTEIRSLSILLFSALYFLVVFHCGSLLMSSFLCFSLVGSLFLLCSFVLERFVQAPVAIPTFGSNLCGSIIGFCSRGGGISYPFSIMY